MNSLRIRLFVFLLALAAVTAAGVGGATYLGVREAADELFDRQLQQMALSLRDQGRIADEERAALEDPKLDYVVQIRSLDGVEVYSTLPAPVLPARTVLGFSTVLVAGQPWRMFSAATPRRIVQVAQPLSTRRALAAAAAGRSVVPIALAAPFVALAMWWLVGATLAPLSRVVRAARQRDAGALEPLPLAGLPGEVTPLVQSFNALLARLAQAFQAQRDFVADAAHELRSPLTALKLQLGLLRNAADAEERDDAVARLASGIERAQRLVEQLLALARADPAAAAVHQALDLAEVCRAAVADSQALAQAQQGRVTLQAPEALPWRGDAQALRSLVRNLVDNALLHGGGQVRVTLRTEQAGALQQAAGTAGTAGTAGLPHTQGAAPPAERGRLALLQVDDAGHGIPDDERERMFDRFHRRHPGRGTGSGLGLAIARAIAGQHGGTVTLQTSPQGGVRAEVRLPWPPTAAES